MRVGSLFTGYGGLDLAVGGDLEWYAEIEPAACKVLAHHYSGVPNLGDITKIDWATVPKVDVITGGYPCQPFSSAGKRKGKNDERHLWPYVRDAIRTLGPSYAILENVRGHLTLGFGDVLADLADIGFNAEWTVVGAADIGAPHKRDRLFIVAYPTCGSGGTRQGWSNPESERTAGFATRYSALVADSSSPKRRGAQHEHLGEATRPTTESGKCSGVDWRQYKPAIQRWEHTLGRPAPDPTIMGTSNRHRLNPVFVEWMMGLPEGWVTGHGLSPAQCLKMLGNGVVPQQAHHAITHLLERTTT
jgi:DNA (cytosine-5)-methyltransferase 1